MQIHFVQENSVIWVRNRSSDKTLSRKSDYAHLLKNAFTYPIGMGVKGGGSGGVLAPQILNFDIFLLTFLYKNAFFLF